MFWAKWNMKLAQQRKRIAHTFTIRSDGWSSISICRPVYAYEYFKGVSFRKDGPFFFAKYLFGFRRYSRKGRSSQKLRWLKLVCTFFLLLICNFFIPWNSISAVHSKGFVETIFLETKIEFVNFYCFIMRFTPVALFPAIFRCRLIFFSLSFSSESNETQNALKSSNTLYSRYAYTQWIAKSSA